MRVKKKWIIFILLIVLILTITSCGGEKNKGQDSHICSYSTTWSKNETKHWKECNCGKRSEEENHFFGEWKEIEKATTFKKGLQEKTCTICDYKLREEIPMVSPVYSWRSIDLFQPTVIVSGKSEMVLDKDGIQKPFVDLVDRQLDMLAQEIVSRLEYVYGNNKQNETHYIKDNTNNTTFTSYESMNAFSESLTTSYSAYDHNDEYVGTGYIMYEDGVATLYDSTIHSHYVVVNGEKYAAICQMNVAGNFTSETAFQYTIQKVTGIPTISHSDDSIYFDKILTLQGAIYGTPTWEYEEKGNTQIYYEFTLNNSNLTPAWNWSNEFLKGTAKDKLKAYLAYIVANNLTSYNELPNENVIFATDYDALLSKVTQINNYLKNNKQIVFDIITQQIIGTNLYNEDYEKGNKGNLISTHIFEYYLLTNSTDTNYYEDGMFKLIYQDTVLKDRIDRIDTFTGYNFSILDIQNLRNYKGYMTIINSILRQITSQSAYQNCAPMEYEIKSSNTSINTTLDETNVYLFLKASSQNDVRIYLDVPYATEVKLIDKDGKEVTFTKENVDGKLALKLKGSVLPGIGTVPNDLSNIQGYGASSSLDELLKNSDYLKLIISDVSSITITTEEAVQVN